MGWLSETTASFASTTSILKSDITEGIEEKEEGEPSGRSMEALQEDEEEEGRWSHTN
jgi:hypothetical protein